MRIIRLSNESNDQAHGGPVLSRTAVARLSYFSEVSRVSG